MDKHKNKTSPESAGIIALQWLTYLFWGLAALATSILINQVVDFWVRSGTDQSDNESVAYAVAACLIVTPIAFVSDIIFSRREDRLSSSVSSIGRIIFAIAYALASLGGLVALVFNLINFALDGASSNDIWTSIATSAVVFATYLKLSVRIIKHNLFKQFRLMYRLMVVLLSVIVASFAIVGPVADAIKTRQDRAIQSTMQFIVDNIRESVNLGKPLPETIDEIAAETSNYLYNQALADKAKNFSREELISYIPNTKQATSIDGNETYFYQICGVFKYQLSATDGETKPNSNENIYLDYLKFGQIYVGKNCYNISTVYVRR